MDGDGQDRGKRDGNDLVASVGTRRVRDHRSRRRAAGLVEVKAWVRAADVDRAHGPPCRVRKPGRGRAPAPCASTCDNPPLSGHLVCRRTLRFPSATKAGQNPDEARTDAGRKAGYPSRRGAHDAAPQAWLDPACGAGPLSMSDHGRTTSFGPVKPCCQALSSNDTYGDDDEQPYPSPLPRHHSRAAHAIFYQRAFNGCRGCRLGR